MMPNKRIAVRSITIEPYEMIRILEVLKYEFENGILNRQETAETCEAIVSYITGTGDWNRYLEVFPENTSVGGIEGFKDIITEGDFTVKTTDELMDALDKAKSGDTIFIAGTQISI